MINRTNQYAHVFRYITVNVSVKTAARLVGFYVNVGLTSTDREDTIKRIDIDARTIARNRLGSLRHFDRRRPRLGLATLADRPNQT